VALNEPDSGSTYLNILIDNHYTDNELHFGMPGGSDDYEADGDGREEADPIHTVSRQRWPATELERFFQETSDVERYVGDHGDNSDADEEEETSESYDGSTQNS